MEIKRKGITLKVNQDYSYPTNPRNDDNMGNMICFHSRLSLGDEHDFCDYQEFKEWLEEMKDDIAVILPLYLLDHSGLSISTTDFNDRWDSGQVGFIFCTKQVAKNFGCVDEEDIKSSLEQEVALYDEYLRGYPNYYYFCVRDEDDNIVDSCSGFRGENLKEMFTEMKEYVDEKYHFLFDKLLKKVSENCL